MVKALRTSTATPLQVSVGVQGSDGHPNCAFCTESLLADTVVWAVHLASVTWGGLSACEEKRGRLNQVMEEDQHGFAIS